MKVLLLAGGWSPEREVSLKGGEQIAAALKERGHSVTPVSYTHLTLPTICSV